jgi:hypothetical protein
VFFEHVYEYHPNGRLKSARATNARGEKTAREYDGSDRNPSFFW